MPLQHSDLDRRSLAIHRLAVEKIEREPMLLSRARETLARWRAVSSARSTPALDEWQRLLDVDGGRGALAVALEDTERAAQLRQSSPLACLLTSPERFAIIKQWRNSHAKA